MHQPHPAAPPPGGLAPTEVQRYLDLSGEMIVQVDADERVSLVNRRLLEVLGFDAADLVEENWFDRCVPESEREATRKHFHLELRAELSGNRYRELDVLAKDGGLKRVRWRYALLRAPSGDPTGLLALGEDVTEQRRAEAELARANRELEAYRFALDASSIVAITDRAGRIVHVNDRQCEVSRFSREELLGQDHRILNSGYHSRAFFKNLWATISGGRIWRGDIRNRAKDGSVYWVATTIVPFLDEHGAPEQFIAIRSEITERKLAEAALERTVRELSAARGREAERSRALVAANEELKRAHAQIREEQAKLIQAEKLSSIGLLAAGVAHEINNPLSGVMACLKYLRAPELPSARRAEYFEAARDGLVRIEQTVRGLLEFSSQRPPAPSRVVTSELVDACLRLAAPLAREKSVAFDTDVDDTIELYVDRSQLMQAVVNVLLNALYVSPPDSKVRVDTKTRGDYMGLCVTDHGEGMPEDVIRRACDPFFSTKPEGEGTGLGLAVTMSIVKAHGGDIEFDSAPGRGTTVTLWLPMEGAPDSVRA